MNLGNINLGKANLGASGATITATTTDAQATWFDGAPLNTGLLAATAGETQATWADAAPVTPVDLPAYTAPDQTLSGTAGIPSAEAFGTGGELVRPEIVGSAGIPSATAFGTGNARLDLQVLAGGAGIPTAAAFGAGKVSGPIVGTTGIASAAAFGSGGFVSTGTLTGSTGIPSAEAFGADGVAGQIGGPLDGTVVPGITSREAFGAGGRVAGPISGAAGIASAEAFGTGGVAAGLFGHWGTGIPSGEAFPTTGKIGRGLSGYLGIPSQEAFGLSGALLRLTSTHTNFALYIGGVNRTTYLSAETLQVDRQLNFQAAANFQLCIRDGSGFKPSPGSEVVVYYFLESTGVWERIFGGSVETAETMAVPGTTTTYIQVTATDYAKALSKRLVNMKFSQLNYGTLDSIMNWLDDNIFHAEGIEWVSMGDPGITIPDLEFNYAPCNEVMDRLSEIVGWEWQVDFFKVLRIYDRPAEITTAPFDITEETGGTNGRTWADLTVRDTRGLYRNRQYIKATFSAKSKTLTESYTNPTNETVPAYPTEKYFDGQFLKDQRYYGNVLRINSIKVDGTPVAWYSQWADASYQVFNNPPANWDFMQIWPNDLQLIWNLLGKPGLYPGVGHVVTVEFEQAMEAPPGIMVENAAEIAARKAVEGGSGIYEAVEEVVDIEDAATLQQIAQQLLDRFSVMGKEVDFSTLRWGLQPGMELTANLPTRGLGSTLMNVERISYAEEGKRQLRCQVTISNQIQQRDALSAFQRLVRRLRKAPARMTQNVTFTLAETIQGIINPGLVTGTNITSAYPLRKKFTVNEAAVYFKTPPTGTSVKLNIKADGVSILPTGTYIEYPVGQTSPIVWTTFKDAPVTLDKGAVITVDVVQTGSGQPGKDGTLVLQGYV